MVAVHSSLPSASSSLSSADLKVWVAEPLLSGTPLRADAAGQGCTDLRRVKAILGQALVAEACTVTKVEMCPTRSSTTGYFQVEDFRTPWDA